MHAIPAVTSARVRTFQFPVGIRLAAVIAMLAVAGCSNSATASRNSPSPSAVVSASPPPSPSLPPTPTPSPSPAPSPEASPIAVPTWAAMHATCSGALAPQEALLTMKGSSSPVLADVTDPVHPRIICTIIGSWTPQLVSQEMVSWWASQGDPSSPGASVIATLDVITGTTAVAASWTGGGFMDGLHAWSPDHFQLVYVTSDTTTVGVHLRTGAGDRLLTSFGAVPGRGVNPIEDDDFIGFSPDGAYFAFEQTFTGAGDHLIVWSRSGVVFSQPSATMATWGSSDSKLYFRQPNASVIYVWDSTGPAGNRSQAFGQQLAWIRPRADAGDDYVAFTVRDSAGSPQVWLLGHSGRAGAQLRNVRSSPSFLNAGTVFLVEEAPCNAGCGIGPAIQPDQNRFTYSIASQTETPSSIASVLGAWPRPGQV